MENNDTLQPRRMIRLVNSVQTLQRIERRQNKCVPSYYHVNVDGMFRRYAYILEKMFDVYYELDNKPYMEPFKKQLLEDGLDHLVDEFVLHVQGMNGGI